MTGRPAGGAKLHVVGTKALLYALSDIRTDGQVFPGPIEALARQQLYPAAVKPVVHPVALELDLIQPTRAVGRLADKLRELRLDPRG